jgi:hypothetical protein
MRNGPARRALHFDDTEAIRVYADDRHLSRPAVWTVEVTAHLAIVSPQNERVKVSRKPNPSEPPADYAEAC